MVYEIKYYSVSNPRKFLQTETRNFVFQYPETIAESRERLKITIKSDIERIEEFDRNVIMTTIRYCSSTTVAQFSEQLYTPDFNFIF